MRRFGISAKGRSLHGLKVVDLDSISIKGEEVGSWTYTTANGTFVNVYDSVEATNEIFSNCAVDFSKLPPEAIAIVQCTADFRQIDNAAKLSVRRVELNIQIHNDDATTTVATAKDSITRSDSWDDVGFLNTYYAYTPVVLSYTCEPGNIGTKIIRARAYEQFSASLGATETHAAVCINWLVSVMNLGLTEEAPTI